MVLHCELDGNADMTHIDPFAVEQVGELLTCDAHTFHLIKFGNHFGDYYCLEMQTYLKKVRKVSEVMLVFWVLGLLFKEWLFNVRHYGLGILTHDFRSEYVVVVWHVLFNLEV